MTTGTSSPDGRGGGRTAPSMHPPDGYIEWTLRVVGSPDSGRLHADPLFEATGRVATWDFTPPHEAVAQILGMLDTADTAGLRASAGALPTLLPDDAEITMTLRYVDAPTAQSS